MAIVHLIPGEGQDCTCNSVVQLSDLSERDRVWDTHRAETSVVQALYSEAELFTYADRLYGCSQWLGFSLEAQDTGDLVLRLQDARFCRVRHCPVCQWRRSLMWRARFLAALPQMLEVYPKHRWVFLTLTVRNCPADELRSQVNLMAKAWDRLTKRKAWPAIGYVRTLEVTRSAIGEAHPHYHCLLLVPPAYFTHKYVTKSAWQELWQRSLKIDYLPVVDVKSVRDRLSSSEHSALAKAILETLKYGVKVQDLTADSAWLAELTKQMHKSRAVSVGGVLKAYVREDEPEDLIHAENVEENVKGDAEIWFTWKELAKRYTLKDT